MFELLEPIRVNRLKDEFIGRFENLILSGEIQIGQKLPSERDLASRLGVSRPVVHEGLLELAAKGLVTMKSRAGAEVNDYRRQGSLPLISSLLEYGEGRLDRHLLESIVQFRSLLESPFARLAAKNRSEEQLAELESIVARERSTDRARKDSIVALDFEFHLLVSLASGNLVFPLLINSFKQVYTNLTGQFFEIPDVIQAVHDFHEQLLVAIKQRDPDRAERVMNEMLAHGETMLTAMLDSQDIGRAASE